MAALTGPRATDQRSGDRRNLGLAADAVIHQGALVALDAGFLVPMSVATDLVAVGRADQSVDNTDGAAGDVSAEVRAGIFRFANSAGADEITAEDIGSTCYGVDDQTVALTDGTSTRSAAGTIFDVDAQGVWVDLR